MSKELFDVIKFADWDNVLEILLLSSRLFIQNSENILNETTKVENIRSYFNKNHSKSVNKIKILIYIFAFYKFKGQYCVAQNISDDLKFSKATLYRNIKKLEKEKLIKKEKIDNKKREYLIPFL